MRTLNLAPKEPRRNVAGLPGFLSNIHSRLDTRNWALPPAISLIFKNLGREGRKGRVEKREQNLKRQITGTKLIMPLRRRREIKFPVQ